ncbi:hypothetical protein V8E52_007091 [Russula decolorans]
MSTSQAPYRSQQDATLLIDGYISHSFGPPSAERHFSHILKSNAIFASYRAGPDGGSFIVNFPDQYSCVLDRRVLSVGTVVPQILWIPHTVTDRRQHVQDAQLQMPIYFQHTDGRLGLSLEAAVGGRCHTLLNSQFSAPLGSQTTTHIRVGWRGYREFKRQVQIRDETQQRNTVTLSKFVQHVGRSVDAFLKTAQVDFENQVPQWRIGERGIQPHEIIIIGAVQVSSGGWMPLMQLTRYIF